MVLYSSSWLGLWLFLSSDSLFRLLCPDLPIIGSLVGVLHPLFARPHLAPLGVPCIIFLLPPSSPTHCAGCRCVQRHALPLRKRGGLCLLIFHSTRRARHQDGPCSEDITALQTPESWDHIGLPVFMAFRSDDHRLLAE